MLASSTPDALWSATSLRVLRPATVACRGISSGRLLDRCSLELTAGQRLLLVGSPPEAASRLVRVLAGVVRPRRGTVSLAGMRGPASAVGGHYAAYVARSPGLAPWMTPREVLTLAASLVGLSRGPARLALERVVSLARLPPDALDDPLSAHGADVAERTDLAAALLGDPEVVLLDEPLRSVGAAERLQLLRFGGERRTVVIASRSPERDAPIASHVALLRRGRVVLRVSIADLGAAGLSPTVDTLAGIADRLEGGANSATPRKAVLRR